MQGFNTHSRRAGHGDYQLLVPHAGRLRPCSPLHGVPLYPLYLLKEELRLFWNLPNSTLGQSFLTNWIRPAKAVGNAHFNRLAGSLDQHRAGLLGTFRYRISTGPLEGLNSKIEVLKRVAYGFRDEEYFRLRLHFPHEEPTSPFPG